MGNSKSVKDITNGMTKLRDGSEENMSVLYFYPTGIKNEYPQSCYGVHDNGYHTIDPKQDGVDPITVFCNTSSSPVTAVLHHNLEDWTLVSGYERPGSYNAPVGSGQLVLFVSK